MMVQNNRKRIYKLGGGHRNVPQIGRGPAKDPPTLAGAANQHRLPRSSLGSMSRNYDPTTKLRLASWNVGSMTSRSIEIGEMMLKRNIDILCVQETKWSNLGNKTRFLNLKTKTHKLFFHGIKNGVNGVGIIVNAKYFDKMVSVTKISDRVMSVKLIIEDQTWNVISAYAPQIGSLDYDTVATQFWLEMNNLINGIPTTELVFIGADFNGHVGEYSNGYDECHGKYGYGSRNHAGESILEFAKAHDLSIINTRFKKQQKHLITFTSGANSTQIDYLLCKNKMKHILRDCKTILGEEITHQHKLLIAEVRLKKIKSFRSNKPVEKKKWFNLNKESCSQPFIHHLTEWISDIIEASDELTADEMWQPFEEECTRVAKKVQGPVEEITMEEVENALRKMKKGRATGPDNIPTEVWLKCGIVGHEFLTILFNKMLKNDSMPEHFRKSFLLPFFKNKGDSRKCGNYRGIKLLCHTMKIWERIIDTRLRNIISLHPNQCGFVGGRSTTDAIQAFRVLMEKYKEAKQDLHSIFIDMEKAFDRVPRDLIWKALRSQMVPEVYVNAIKDMYKEAATMIRCAAGTSEQFQISVGVHQGSVLSPLLFNTVIDFLTRANIDNSRLTLLFADDILIAEEDPTTLQQNLSLWQHSLEDNGLKISRMKTEYLYCSNSDPDNPTPDIYLDNHLIQNCKDFKYLGSKVNRHSSCDDDVKHRVSVGWMKFQENSGILCDKKFMPKLKGRLYTTVIRPALLYGSECWTSYKEYNDKLTATEMKMLRMSAGVTLKDKLRSSYIRKSLGVDETIVTKLEERQMKWYGHVMRRDEEHIVKKSMNIELPRQARRGRPPNTWIRQMKDRQRKYGITDEEINDRQEYRRRLRSHHANPNV